MTVTACRFIRMDGRIARVAPVYIDMACAADEPFAAFQQVFVIAGMGIVAADTDICVVRRGQMGVDGGASFHHVFVAIEADVGGHRGAVLMTGIAAFRKGGMHHRAQDMWLGAGMRLVTRQTVPNPRRRPFMEPLDGLGGVAWPAQCIAGADKQHPVVGGMRGMTGQTILSREWLMAMGGVLFLEGMT